jgi:hypothetical protein
MHSKTPYIDQQSSMQRVAMDYSSEVKQRYRLNSKPQHTCVILNRLNECSHVGCEVGFLGHTEHNRYTAQESSRRAVAAAHGS